MATKSIMATDGAGISRGDDAINQAQPATAAPASTTGSSGNLDQKLCMNSGSRGESRRVQLSQLDTTDIQVRARLDQHVVDEYADLMMENMPFPPIVLYDDGKTLFVADGLHRVAAARKMMFKDIDAVVRKGTLQDATWFALGANREHGLRPNRADVRKAIAVALQLFPKRSNRDIATQIGCSHVTVADAREALESTGQIDQLDETVGADGKARPAKRKRKALIAILSPQMPDIPPAAPVSDSSEDTCSVHDASDTIGEADGVSVVDEKPVGLAIAREALATLDTIPDNDPERHQALTLVADWLENALHTSCPGGAAEGTVPA